MRSRTTRRKLSSVIYRHSEAAKNYGEMRNDLRVFGKKIQAINPRCTNDEVISEVTQKKQDSAIDMSAKKNRWILCNRIGKIVKSSNKFAYSNRLPNNKPKSVLYPSSLQNVRAMASRYRMRKNQRRSSFVKSSVGEKESIINDVNKEHRIGSKTQSSTQNRGKFGGRNLSRTTPSQKQKACKQRLVESEHESGSRGNCIENSVDEVTISNQNSKHPRSKLEKKISKKVNQIRASAKYKKSCNNLYRGSECIYGNSLQVSNHGHAVSELRFFNSIRREKDMDSKSVENSSTLTDITKVENYNSPTIRNDLTTVVRAESEENHSHEDCVNIKRNMNVDFATSIAKLNELSNKIDRATKSLDSSFSHRTAAQSVGETISTNNHAVVKEDLKKSYVSIITSDKVDDGILSCDVFGERLSAQLTYNDLPVKLPERLNETESFIRQVNISSESVLSPQYTSSHLNFDLNVIHNGSDVEITSDDDAESVSTLPISSTKMEFSDRSELVKKGAQCHRSRIQLYDSLGEESKSGSVDMPFDAHENIVSDSLECSTEDGYSILFSAENKENLECSLKSTSCADRVETNSHDRSSSEINDAVNVLCTSAQYSDDDYHRNLVRVVSSQDSPCTSKQRRFLSDKLKRRMLIDRTVNMLRQYYIDVIEYFHALRKLLARAGRVEDAKKICEQSDLMEQLCLSHKKSILSTIRDQCSFEEFRHKSRKEMVNIDNLRMKIRYLQSVLHKKANLYSPKLVDNALKQHGSGLSNSTQNKQKNEQILLLRGSMDDKWKKQCSDIGLQSYSLIDLSNSSVLAGKPIKLSKSMKSSADANYSDAPSLHSERVHSLMKKLREKRDEATILRKYINERTCWHSPSREKSPKIQCDAHEHYISEAVNDLLTLKNLSSEAERDQVSHQQEDTQKLRANVRNDEMSVISTHLLNAAESQVESISSEHTDHTIGETTFSEIDESITSVKSLSFMKCDSTNISGKSEICTVSSCYSGSIANQNETVEQDRLTQNIFSPVAGGMLNELMNESMNAMVSLIHEELIASLNYSRLDNSLLPQCRDIEGREILKMDNKCSSLSESLLNDASWLNGSFDLNKIPIPRDLFNIPNLDLTEAEADLISLDGSAETSTLFYNTAITAGRHLSSTRNDLENFNILNAEHESELRDLLKDYVQAIEKCLAENQPITIIVEERTDESDVKFQCRQLLADLCCEVCSNLMRSPPSSSRILACKSFSYKRGKLYSVLEREVLIPILKGNIIDDFVRKSAKWLDRNDNSPIVNLVLAELQKYDTKCDYDDYEEKIICELANELCAEVLHQSLNA